MPLLFGLFSTLSASGADVLKVASFSTVLTEIAQQVGGNHVNVAGLVKPGQDPHEYQPTPDDLRQAGDAKLILLRESIWNIIWIRFKRPLVEKQNLSRWAMLCRT